MALFKYSNHSNISNILKYTKHLVLFFGNCYSMTDAPETRTEQVQAPVVLENQTSLNEAQQFFMKIQRRRLNYLYPSYKSAQVQSAAKIIWQCLSHEQKQFYAQKSKRSQQDEMAILQTWAKSNFEAIKLKKQSKFGNQDGEIIQSQEQTQTKNQGVPQRKDDNGPEIEQRAISQPNSESSSEERATVAFSREVSHNASHNQDNSTYAVICDQTKTSCNQSPKISVVIQNQKSQIVDSEIPFKQDIVIIQSEAKPQANSQQQSKTENTVQEEAKQTKTNAIQKHDNFSDDYLSKEKETEDVACAQIKDQKQEK